eukprot:760704-Hanusia_phi.AAC.1
MRMSSRPARVQVPRALLASTRASVMSLEIDCNRQRQARHEQEERHLDRLLLPPRLVASPADDDEELDDGDEEEDAQDQRLSASPPQSKKESHSSRSMPMSLAVHGQQPTRPGAVMLHSCTKTLMLTDSADSNAPVEDNIL